MTTALALAWSQVHAHRLARHQLDAPAPLAGWPAAVSAIGGLHAQLMPAAELSLAARVAGATPATVQDALWSERTLIKTWAMRGTLHLLAAADFSLYAAAMSLRDSYRKGAWLKFHDLTLAELDAILAGVRDILTDEGLAREELAEALAAHVGRPALREKLLSGWGALLKPSAALGDLCFGPSRGQNVTFVSPRRWLGAQPSHDPQTALLEVARRFLAAYGPATPEDFARWWGMQPAPAKKVFRSLAAELVECDVEGWRGWAPARDAEALLAAPTQHDVTVPAYQGVRVRLLPYFDMYTVGAPAHSRERLAGEHAARIYRSQGWISPVLLVGDRFAGVWEYEKKGERVVVKVQPFAALDTRAATALEEEAARLGNFWGAGVETVIE